MLREFAEKFIDGFTNTGRINPHHIMVARVFTDDNMLRMGRYGWFCIVSTAEKDYGYSTDIRMVEFDGQDEFTVESFREHLQKLLDRKIEEIRNGWDAEDWVPYDPGQPHADDF